MLETAGEMVERFHTRDPLNGMLRLGLNEELRAHLPAGAPAAPRATLPGIKTSVFVGDTGLVSQSLNRKELDIAIVSEPKVGAHVRIEPIGRNRLGWFASADFELARGVLTPADLCQFHLIVSPPTAQLHTTANQWFAQAAPSRAG
jgi:DNA-binding transcriptional LysR family regulator